MAKKIKTSGMNKMGKGMSGVMAMPGGTGKAGMKYCPKLDKSKNMNA